MKKIVLLLYLCVSHVSLADDLMNLAPVIDNSHYPSVPTGSTAGILSQPVNQSLSNTFELMTRLDEAQNDIQQLTGKLEEQANIITELKRKQTAIYADFDDRLQQLENKINGVKPVSPEVPAVKESTPEPVVPVKSSAATPVSTTTPSDDKKQPYQQAFDMFRNGQTVEAIAQFNTLLSKDPNSPYANNAQYWLGRAYRVNKTPDLAKKAFSLLLEKYPTSTKVPEALMELSFIELEQKNTQKAKEYLTRVITDFPNSKFAEMAAKKLQQTQ